jgi:8-oxo-dGTP pyrophosphatase MutT (NUDIX family)
MKNIDKIAWLHLDGGRILSTRSKGKNRFYFPGGKRERDETDAQTLLREIREELTVELVGGSLKCAGTFEAQAHGHNEGVRVIMTCYYAAYTGTLQPAAEIEEVVWLSYRDRESVSPVDQLIFDWLKEQMLLVE